MACAGGHVEVAQWLAAQAAQLISLADQDGATPLHHACMQGQLAACRWLVEAGADIAAVTRGGEGMLAVAEASEQEEVVQWLRGLAGGEAEGTRSKKQRKG